MGRHATPKPESREVAVDAAVVESSTAALDTVGQARQVTLAELAMDIGAIRALDMIQKFASIAQVKLFKNVRECNEIKHLPVRGENGQVKYLSDLREFCPVVFGRTYQSMLDAEARFDVLGEEAYEAGTRLRLNTAALRSTRALPPEKLELVRTAIANGSAKAEVLSVIEDLAEKVERTEKALDDARHEKVAADRLLADKNTKIDQLSTRIARETPDDAHKALLAEAAAITSEAVGNVRGRVRKALVAVLAADPAQIPFATGLLGQLQAELDGLRQEFGLPEAAATPEWQQWVDAQEAGKQH